MALYIPHIEWQSRELFTPFPSISTQPFLKIKPATPSNSCPSRVARRIVRYPHHKLDHTCIIDVVGADDSLG